MDEKNRISKPVFILGSHKSGTTLMRSLLDGHSKLAVLPFETHVFRHLNRWIEYPYQKNIPGEISPELFIESAIQWIKKVNSNQDPYADKRIGLEIDEEAFNTEIKRICTMDLPNLISTYYRAVLKAVNLNGQSDTGRIVEKSVEQAEYAIDLKNAFPDAIFIHMIRNPYANFLSIRKYKGALKYPDLEPISKALFSSYYYLYRNRHLIDTYHVVRYEDLVSNTREVMKNISAALEINFEKETLVPTSNGILWEGNSVTNKKFNSVTAERIKFDQSDIKEIEKEIVNKYFSKVLEDFNYPEINRNKSILRKNRDEDIKTYIKNRSIILSHQL